MNQDSTKPGPEGMKGSWRDRLGINKELPKIAEEFKEPTQKAQAAEPPQEKPSSPPVRAPLAKPAPMAPRPNAAEFGERLRQQREAAERMAEQRVAEAKERATNEQRPPSSPQPPQQRNAAPPSRPPAAAKPRFGFAEEELRNARPEPPAAKENPPRQWNSSQSASIARPVFTADRQGAPADPRLRAPPPQRAPAAPQARNLPPTQQGRVPPPPASHAERPPPRPTRPAAPQPTDRLRRTSSADDSYAQGEPYRRSQRQAEIPRSRNEARGAHSRELDYVDEESDDLFEDEQSYSAQPRRRATAQDYGQAYREFDGEPQERRRTGPFLLIAALVTVGALAGGLIYFYQTNTGNQATSAENVPVLDEPSAPVKTQPETSAAAEDPAPPTQDQSMASTPEMQAPQAAQKKQIYDRILGETTLEEQEEVVPSEEQPVPPQGEQSQGFDADPLPLPLPPSPGGGAEDQSGSLEPTGPPTSVAGVKASSEASPEDASPASATLVTEPAEQSETAESETAEQSEAALAPPPAPAAADEPEASPPVAPEPRQAEKQPDPVRSSETAPAARQKAPAAEKKIDTELAFAEQPAVAPSKPQGDGPVQIAQLPGFNASSETTTTYAPIPHALPDLDQGSSTTQRRARPIGTRESDKVVVNPNRNFNRGRQVQVAQIEPDPIATQSVSQAPTLAQGPSQPEPKPQPATVQQQAALEPAPAPAQARVSHGTGTGFTIQLASYKSEADALAGYEQLRLQHGQLVGSLAPNIQKADLGANGTFYRLHLGSFASKDAARKACSSLLAAGERDCIVKSR